MEDAAGFGAFMAARYRALVRSAFLLVGDAGLAEDLVQSALYRTFLAWRRLRAEQAAEAYTRTTLIRLAGRWSRRRWRGEVPGLAHDGQEPGRARGSYDPREQIDDGGAAMDVRNALAQLPWPQRATLVLRYFDDLTEVETAQIMGCSVGTVKSRASRGLDALRASSLVQSLPEGEVRRG
jgi:RNA polymerase sigma-70 factor (sigma-E family)